MARPSRTPKARRIAYFLLRRAEELDQLTGGTWSTVSQGLRLERSEPVFVVSRSDSVRAWIDAEGARCIEMAIPEIFDGTWRSPVGALRLLANLARSNASFYRLARREQIDILQCDEAHALTVLFGAKLAGARLVVTFRNVPNVAPHMRWVYRIPSAFADAVVSTSRSLHEVVVAQAWGRAARESRVIYNGVDLTWSVESDASARADARREIGIGEGELALGVIGFLVSNKGQAEFLEQVVPKAAADLRAHRARVFFFGGEKEPEYAERCKSAVRAHRLEDLVVFRGYTPDMKRYYRALDLNVYPGIEGPARALIEGAATGLPAVALRGCSEAVEHERTGLLCETLADFPAAMTSLLADAELRQAMGREAQRLARERFALDETVRAFESLFEELHP